jgi:hypothetical protein
MSHVAFRAPRTKVRYTLRDLPALPLPQICRSLPRLPIRTRRPLPRRATLHLRPPLHFPRTIPTGQVQHRQAILAAHRSRHLESAGRTVSRNARISLINAHVDSSQKTLCKPALRIVQTCTLRASVRRRRAAWDGPVCVPRAAVRTESRCRRGGAGEGRASPSYCGLACAR